MSHRVITRCDGVRFVVNQAEVRKDGSVVYHCWGHLVNYAFRGSRATKLQHGPTHKVEGELVDHVNEMPITPELAEDLFEQNLRALNKEGRLGRSGRRVAVLRGNRWADPDTTA